MSSLPSLSSFVSSNQYNTESTTLPVYAAYLTGQTYNPGITFNGYCGAVGDEPGGLFGWLVYSRATQYATPKGSTTASYIVYTDAQELTGDLNKLGGITFALLGTDSAGSTYSLFKTAGVVDNITRISAQNSGEDYLFCINHLAYGGTLVIAGSVAGLNAYTAETGNEYDLALVKNPGTTYAQWLITQPYTLGLFPTVAPSGGITGEGVTMANFTTLFGSASYVTGNTVSNRVFNVYGVKAITNQDTSTLLANSQITYNITAVPDVGGFYIRALNRNEQYLTIAGIDRATPLNGSITNSISWSSSLKSLLRTNRVNFFVNNNPQFLGSDLTGATASATYTQNDRVGPAKLKVALTEALTNIGLKYLFDINNTATRAQVTAEVQSALDPFTPYLDTTATQVICNGSNNTDNSGTLTIEVVIKPITSVDSLLISVVLAQ